MSYKIILIKQAKKDLKKYRGTPYVNTINEILKTIHNNPYEPTNSFEKLMPPGDGYYSRRINIQDRIVYKINSEEKLVTIFSVKGHYK
ncbi:hypothetical protein BGL34_03755 [Fructilactobacillus lindneri]|uniref:Endoribonuclease YoeB n=2 Tax=Fructilactobacillus lindneri TaxID=53444 RepID=A0A0R2JUV1_9LACO|nr:Txe/YoeB family addiction module toxin [Fructilactobacillus lindneri]ANZ57763.1 hypothetical protein AYR60_02780 [Fructilactobacillus lindneri]ANZ59032.1 hypothetical protein AYR59_02780 [Fructilactobacillus lindneri]KRN78796.1 hypothetical protein IV52_GL001076 [Fructilactobacillus lindneri DSM 20690 = JCM 11027]POG98086.1 hypothetical protein BGL31_03110 [Fructilactobacillus lindneri]POH01799.1 hypothetical protein BGL32_04320 [Fructilactobacillus lindneri]